MTEDEKLRIVRDGRWGREHGEFVVMRGDTIAYGPCNQREAKEYIEGWERRGRELRRRREHA